MFPEYPKVEIMEIIFEQTYIQVDRIYDVLEPLYEEKRLHTRSLSIQRRYWHQRLPIEDEEVF